ncbi:type IVB secretion system protein IcmH/DotU [Oceaniglobus roseus]|uniref:type IVB secretion system protein IcmH/DotU n=1 Tax=Oceaniglobus roseus TaxID=1737570 RepID=UPI000C7F777A|nr:type IVB secretion system protein IcmH/DotU [Kandeliimicrobium roseum]
MADEDPFAEPEDGDRTVIRPNPGGRRGVATPLPGAVGAPQAPAAAALASGPAVAPAAAAPHLGDAVTGAMTGAMTGLNPLNAAASTLFSLVSRIRNRAQHPDPDALRRSVVAEVRAFESRAIAAQVDPRTVKVARYAICATLDDVVLNTPWGGQSIWAQQSMVGTFHRETVGGDRFFDLLHRLEQDPATNLLLLEFLYVCLSLGFEGRLRVEQGGADRHMQIRAGLARIIRNQRGEVEHDLSPHWKGVEKPHKPLSAWKPVWIAVAVTALLLSGGYIGLSQALSRDSERVLGEMAAIDRGGVATLERLSLPVPQPVDDEEELKRVSGFLTQEIKDGLVSVFQDANTITVRMKGAGMFPSASDQVKDEFGVPLGRVADALNDTTGPVIIAGHSDNVPLRSSRFANNMALSLARAESVKKMIEDKVKDPSRLKAEGRSDREPIADNKTKEGRALNRRIEFILVKTGVTQGAEVVQQ